MARDYTPRQERIITYLEGRRTPTDANTLLGYIGLAPTTQNLDSLRGDIGELIRAGLVKAYTITIGGRPTEAYHLKQKGKETRSRIQGHGKLETFIRKYILPGILILFGFVLLAYPSFTTTGNAVVTNQNFVNSDLGFIIAVISIIIGGILLVKLSK